MSAYARGLFSHGARRPLRATTRSPIVLLAFAALWAAKHAVDVAFAVGTPPSCRPRSFVPRRASQDADEQSLSAASEHFANLRLRSELEEILGCVPQSRPLKDWKLKGGILVARLGLNFFTMGKHAFQHGLTWQGWKISLLPWAEFAVYLFILGSAIIGICSSIGLDASLPYKPENNARWRKAASGAVRLRQAGGFSALSLMDAFRTVGPEIKLTLEKNKAKGLSPMQKGGLELLKTLVLTGGRGAMGMLAFSVKLQTFDGTLFHLLGLANQVTHIAETQDIEKDAVDRFVFTGEDAKWDEPELEALREFEGRTLKSFVKDSGFIIGTCAYADMDASDLQKILIDDVTTAEGTPDN